MTTYTTVFGGDTVPPSDYAYRAVTISADTTFYWPDNNDGPNLIASIMDVTPTVANVKLLMPAANQVSDGRDVLIRNVGSETLAVRDNGDNAIATVAPGEGKYFYLTDNSTAAGTWSVFTYGTGTSGADATALAGKGLTVLVNKLNQMMQVVPYGTGITITTDDRAAALRYTSGAGTWYLPDPTTVPNGFFFTVTNSGTGTLTLDASTNGGLIDGLNTKTIQPGESAFAISDSTTWITVGYGRSTEFAFTQLAIDASTIGVGGLTITSAQASNKLWYFYNTAGGDRTVTIPAVASVYFLRVGAIGAGNDLTFTTGSGSTVSLSANQSYTIYCDGTNVVSAQTVAVTSTASLDDGSASTPALSFSLDTDTGLYRATTNTLGIAANGAMVAEFSPTGLNLATPLAVTEGGTGVATLTGIVKAAGTAPFTAAAAGTDYVAPGGALGTPSSGTLTNCTGLPVSTGISGLGANVATMLATPTKANFDAALSDDNFAYLGTVQTFTKAQLIHPDSDVAGLTVRGGAGGTANALQVQDNASNPLLTVSGTGVLTANLASSTGLPLTTGVTGVLPVANGGTNSTTFDTNLLSSKMYAAATGTDTYAVTLSPAPAAYVEGMTVLFKAANANTGASTLNVNGLGALAIQNPDGSALSAGVIASGGVYMAVYDGTQFKLNRGPTGATGPTGPAGTDGQSTSYTVSTQTATASQTVFNVTYTVGLIDVYQNGSRLVPTTDYAASNGTTVVLTTGATDGDELTFVVWTYVSVANALTAADIGVSVQAYDADLTSWAGIAPSAKADSGAITSSGLTMATARLIGRTTAGTGAPEEISVSGATLSGGVLTIASGAAPVTRSARTSNTILGTADKGTFIDITSGTFSQTFDAAATLGDGWWCYIRNSGTGDITLDPNSSETIDGLTSFVMYPGEVRLVQCDGSVLRSFVITPFARTFTATGTFIAPPGYSTFFVRCIGGGGGGGSGGRGAAGSYRNGGCGGGGGANIERLVSISAGTSVTATVASGGTGGAAKTTDGYGSSGNAGGASSFGSYFSAYGGGGGGGGTNDGSAAYSGSGGGAFSAGATAANNGPGGEPSASVLMGGAFGTGSTKYNIGEGGAAGDSGTANSAMAGGSSGGGVESAGGGSATGGAGGGAGGGINTSNAQVTAKDGGKTNAYNTQGGGASGGAAGVTGTAGADASGSFAGGGGGGGGCGLSANAGAGGAGGAGGGGGGGGGASVTGYNSGAGGAGGRGECRIWGVI